MRVLRFASLPVSRWANGAGRKADLLAGDGWMAGFAWLDADAPFSDLAGMDRTITLVEGPGFTLDVAGRAPLVVHAPWQPAAFDGGAATHCRVLGPSLVLNAMSARGRIRHEVAITGRPAPGGAALARILVVLGGQALAGDTAVTPLDAIVPGGGAVPDPGDGAVFADVTFAAW